jgi:hypothetical protein
MRGWTFGFRNVAGFQDLNPLFNLSRPQHAIEFQLRVEKRTLLDRNLQFPVFLKRLA